MIRYIYEWENPNDPYVEQNIECAKSDSGCCGSKLRKVHYKMGMQIGEAINKIVGIKDVVLLPLLTGAIPFAFGVGEVIDVKMMMVDPHSEKTLPDISESTIVIIDEVINTGRKVLKIADYYRENHRVILATAVMPEDSEAFDSEYDVFSYRLSKHRYEGAMVNRIEGAKGPDTAARLYSLF